MQICNDDLHVTGCMNSISTKPGPMLSHQQKKIKVRFWALVTSIYGEAGEGEVEVCSFWNRRN